MFLRARENTERKPMKYTLNTRYNYPDFLKTVRALKAVRLRKGLSRKDAANLLGWSACSFEQLENGRCNFPARRLQKILSAYDISPAEFDVLRKQPKVALAEPCERGEADRTVARKPRRNHLKIITREVRVLRALRRRKGLSQYAASHLCAYAPSMFGHIEEGRVELRPDNIEHILKSIGRQCPLFCRPNHQSTHQIRRIQCTKY